MPEDLLDAPPLRLQLPTEGELSPSEINSLIGTATMMRKMDLESKAAARRYRGQQALQQLIQQGVPMDQAMQRVAGDLFFNDVHGFLGYRQAEENRKLRELTQERLRQQAEALNLHRLVLERQGQERIDKPAKVDLSSLNRQLSGVNSRIKQAEGKITAGASEEQRAAAVSDLQALYDERDEVQNEIKNAGGNVAITPRPNFQTVPQVGTPPDMRSGLQRILPNFLGGASPPGPVTNMVTRMVPPSMPPPAPAGPATPAVPAPNFPVPPSTPTMFHPDNVPVGPIVTNTSPPPPMGPAPGPAKRVRVKSATGKVGTIPETQLDEAIKEGYTLVQ